MGCCWCAGYREASSAGYHAHGAEQYSSAQPPSSAPAAHHHRYSERHTPSEAYATPPPKLQREHPPSATAFPPDGARPPLPDQDFRRREPEGVPRHDVQPHAVHAERQRHWTHDGDSMQRRPDSGGAARHADSRDAAAGEPPRGSPAPNGHVVHGSPRDAAPQQAEPLDGKEFFRRCAPALQMLHCLI